MAEKVIRNKNLRSEVTLIEQKPDLKKLGRAGIRFKLDQMLMVVHGHPEREWRKLDEEERSVLRQIAREADPAWGVSHQVNAIGALGVLRDKAALLQLSELARNTQADLRLQVAATHAMGEIGGAQARPALLSLLSARAPEVRAQAANALIKAGSATEIAALESLAKEDKTFAGEIAKEAVDALRARLRLRQTVSR